MAKKAEPIEIDLSVEVTLEARQGLGKESGRAGAVTIAQMERHLQGILRDELDRLVSGEPDADEERD